MFKYIFIFATMFFGTTVQSTLNESEAQPITLCDIQNEYFLAGEEISYKIFYNVNLVWLGVGEVRFKVREDDRYYYTTAYGKTFSFYDIVFPVRDTIETTIDKNTMLPVESKRVVNEGKYSTIDVVTYDYDKGVAYSRKGKSLAEATLEEVPIENCSRDILSTIYGIRNVSLEQFQQSEQVNLNLLMDRKSYPIKVNYMGETKQRIKGKGKKKVHVINPELIASETFKDKDAMKVYVSSDGNNLPLMIESPISVGNVKAVLQHGSGLKYPTSD